ncbi:sugar ABC transporter substrate-binding protein [Paenibacillus arenilitoris]|uniref:Sugar ABC transporter substrate-binding protein n=1 Tax=Paenibacillus arenilitoris TaxID=2772299 RepID=A0A927CS63_9BACL|nr:sugar ABC transporter substrate-binding protein [Paenibacillus arenilitoris]MBD2870640.1 sugar ABC transporter substrate-binding protein [Paenibacillus arenilitoris]
MGRTLQLPYIGVLALLALSAGCREAAEPPGLPEAPAAERIALRAWIIANTPLAERHFRATIEPYMEQRPNLSVEVDVLSWDTAWSDILGAVTGGDGPDILQLGTTWVPAVAAMDGLDELTDKIGDVGGAEAYLPASWRSTMIEGEPEVYAVPWFVEARVLYYRKDAFRAAGVDPEAAFRDWGTFKDALSKVDGVRIGGESLSAFEVPGRGDWNVAHNLFPWIWGAGADVLTEDRKSAAFHSDQAARGVSYFTGLASEGLIDRVSLGKNSSQVENDFADGKTAVIMSGSWLFKDLILPRDDGGLGGIVREKDIGVSPLPKGPSGNYSFVGGSDLAVMRASKHKEEAWELIVYLSGDEAQLAYSSRTGMLPAKRKWLESRELAGMPGYAAFAESVKHGKSYPSIPQWGPIETALVKHFGGIWDTVAGAAGSNSEQDIRRRLDAAAREVNVILSQGRESP